MDLLTAAPADDADGAVLDWTWALVLTAIDDASCRLLVLVRADYRPRWLRTLLPLLLEPVHFVMERKMLRTIARQTGSAKSTGTRPASIRQRETASDAA